MKHFYEEFRYCARCGSAYRSSDFDPQDSVYRCSSCRLEAYQNSKPSATVIIPRRANDREIVLLTRSNDPGRGRLALPGGFLQYGEDPAVGARREALEEVRLDVTIRRLLCATLIDYAYQGSKVWALELSFIAESVDYDFRGLETEEAGLVDFYDVEAIVSAPERLAFVEQAEVLRAFLAAAEACS